MTISTKKKQDINNKMKKRALITGITGMCGSHLAELLLSKDYEVHGVLLPAATPSTQNIDHILNKITLHDGDVNDYASMWNIIYKVKPQEIYNLAAQSHAGKSFKIVDETIRTCGNAVGHLLDIIRQIDPTIKMWQASTSEFLDMKTPLPWNESTPYKPSNPYGAGKLMAHHLVALYREAYGLHVCSGIMFNNESPRRGEDFVTRKITLAVARIKAGRQKELLLGNIEAQRDWGYSPEYMEAAYLMLQQEKPKDYVIATGETHSVREWLEAAFEAVGLNAYDYYKQDERYMRPSDIPEIRGDSSKIKEELGWEAKTKFRDLIKIMVAEDLKLQ